MLLVPRNFRLSTRVCQTKVTQVGGDVSRRLREELSKTGSRKLRESSGAIDAIVECLDAFEDRQDQDDARIRRLEESKEKLWGRVSLIEATAAEQRGIIVMVQAALERQLSSMDRVLAERNESLLRAITARDLRSSDSKTPSVKPLKIGPVETKLPVWSIMVLAVFGIAFLGIVAGVAYVSVERIRQQGQTTHGK